MCDELEQNVPEVGGTGAQKKQIFLSPRYTYKTSLLVAFMAWLILKFREDGIDITIDYVRAAADLAEEVLYELKQHFALNPFVTEYWGDLSKAAYLWSDKRINFGTKRDPTVSVSGLDRGASGKHPDIVIFDDIVNEKNYDSIVAKRKARGKINAYGPIIPPGWGVMIHCGTRFAFNDVTGWLLDQNETNRRKRDQLRSAGLDEEAKLYEPKWREYIRAYDDGPDGKGSLFFPAVLTHEFVEYQRQELDPRLWAAWYKNECYAEGMLLFRPEYLRYFNGHYSPRSKDDRLIPTLEVFERSGARDFVVEKFPVRVTMTIDPTTTAKGRSDRTGISVVATDWRGYWWVFLSTYLLEVPSIVGERCVGWIAQYVPDIVRIESLSADVEMVKRIQKAIDELGLPTKIRSYVPNRDESMGSPGRPGRRQKIARIEALEPRFRSHFIRLQSGQCEPLIDQYRHWPDVEHDDVMDALAMQHGLAVKCRWDSIEDAEIDLGGEDDEEPDDIMRTMTAVVRTVGGEILRISYDREDRQDEDRLIGRAGAASQRVRVRAR